MKKPNILLITSDQHRADSMGCYGHPVVQTPHLDQLAHEGMRFDAAYADCPVCIPARTTMITGRRAYNNGITRYAADERVERERGDFLGSLVTEAGYQTHLVGKTHWHTEPSFRAGFESVTWQSLMRKEHLTRLGQPMGQYGIGNNELTPMLSRIPPELQLTGWSCERAVEFLQLREREQPFFLWLSIQDPHPPFLIHEPYYSMYDDCPIPAEIESEWSGEEELCPRYHRLLQGEMKTGVMSPAQRRKMRSVYYGMISHMDHQISRVFGTLMYQGDWEDTLVIYTSDHGEFLGDHGAGKKTSFCEASARVPFLVRPPKSWREEPGVAKGLGGSSEAMVELADLLPTICDAAGARIPDDVDGKSVLPIVKGETEKTKDFIHGHINETHMYRDEEYKYVYYADDGSELVFQVDDRDDETALAVRGPTGSRGDLALLDRYRALFVELLAEEGHPDLDSKGNLRNLGLKRPSMREAMRSNGNGMDPIGWSEFDLRRLRELH